MYRQPVCALLVSSLVGRCNRLFHYSGNEEWRLHPAPSILCLCVCSTSLHVHVIMISSDKMNCRVARLVARRPPVPVYGVTFFACAQEFGSTTVRTKAKRSCRLPCRLASDADAAVINQTVKDSGAAPESCPRWQLQMSDKFSLLNGELLVWGLFFLLRLYRFQFCTLHSNWQHYLLWGQYAAQLWSSINLHCTLHVLAPHSST